MIIAIRRNIPIGTILEGEYEISPNIKHVIRFQVLRKSNFEEWMNYRNSMGYPDYSKDSMHENNSSYFYEISTD